MKITPLEIRQKTFEKVFRGFDKDEVQAYLQSLSTQWEKMQEEIKELKQKYDTAQKEVQKLRDVEGSLYKALKTAEDTGANVIDQANKTADLHLKETQMKADALLSEAKSRARNALEEAEMKTREIIEAAEDEVKDIEQQCKTIEEYRENLLSELTMLSNNTLERVERTRENRTKIDFSKKLKRLKDLEENEESIPSKKPQITQNPSNRPGYEDTPKENTASGEEAEARQEPSQRSFFDDID